MEAITIEANRQAIRITIITFQLVGIFVHRRGGVGGEYACAYFGCPQPIPGLVARPASSRPLP